MREHDYRFMTRALELARLGLGRTSPNPPVGAVIVKEGRIIAEGYHRAAGLPHAEAEALAAAGPQARDADLYCTLEPCCHHGRTPPCTEAIIAAGIRRVVYAYQDPDPRCAGKGAATLQTAGIIVERGLLASWAVELYEPYVKHKRTGLPFVVLKLAMTLDGKVATATGQSFWITAEPARRLVHQWRNEADAVMIGIGTALTDDPLLTVRAGNADLRQPLRVIVDSHARLPLQARMLQQPGQTLIAIGPEAPRDKEEALQAAGAETLRLPKAEQGLDLNALMEALGQRNIMSVLVEGGPTLAAGLLKAGLVDKFRFFYAPKLMGASGRAALGELQVTQLSEARRLRLQRVQLVGEDILVTAYPDSRD